MEHKKYRFIRWSCEVSPNVLDWIRSIYFSLLGSSMLTFFLKVSVLSPLALIIFALGVSAFWIALFLSVSIANSFKKHEKNYDGKDEGFKKTNEPESFYYKQEIDTKSPKWRNFQHFLLYFIWIPAFACIAYVGCYMENKSSKSNTVLKEKIKEIKIKVEQLDSSQNVIDELQIDNEKLHDSITTVTLSSIQQGKQIDSLNKVVKSLQPKTNKNQSKK